MHEMIHPLGTLLEDTFKILRERWKAFLVIGLLTGVVNVALNGVTFLLDAVPDEETAQADWSDEEWGDEYEETYDEYYEEYYDEYYVEELREQGFTEEEIAVLLEEDAQSAEEEMTDEEGAPLSDVETVTLDDEEEILMTEEETDWSDPAVIVGMGGFIVGGISFFLLIMWLSVWLQTAAMLLSFPKKILLGKALRESARVSLFMLGVIFFIFVFSGVWLIVPAIFLPFPISLVVILAIFVWAMVVGPRLSIAPIVYLEERKGMHAAVKRAFEVTRGRWLKIVGNMLAITFVIGAIATGFFLVTLIAMVPVLFLAFISPYILIVVGVIGVVLLLFVMAVLPMIQQIFLVQLSLTLLKNPKHPVKK